jgi:cytochrome c-type biogenesis protein CcmF
VRSGVLSSVHAFATDPTRGLFILAFLVIVVGASLALFAWRAPSVGLGARFALLSRETLLLANNVLLLVATAAVLLGTLYPLLLDALGLGKISVGPPYFDTVFVPLMAPLVFLMGVGPIARWKQSEVPDIVTRLRWAAGVAVVCAVAASWIAGKFSLMSGFGLLMGYWVVAAVATDLWERIAPRAGHATTMWQKARLIPRASVGMMLAHLGVAVFIFGVSMVRTHEVERDVKMKPGDYTDVAGWRFTLTGLREREGPNFTAMQGIVEVSRDGRKVLDMYPEKRVYRVQTMPMTEADIHARVTGDLYVSLGEAVEDGAWIVRVYVKPYVNWIWGGCVLMALGGIFAASDRRYRQRKTADDKLPQGAMAA